MLWNTKWFPGTNLQDLNLDWILKKISALRGGNTGQYLYKKSDKDFDFGWKTGGGGGGGTSDYLDLDNKPSINNVELLGNKTAAELGLAAAADIPEVPVQSVNGKTGAVVLDATDVGAGTYTKPSGGIPKTDLTSAVQTSLDKADSALQAVPPTYRTAAAQDAIDAAQDSNLATIESSPATAAHAVGEYIVLNGHLYKVTAAIAAGQTLTVGTNIAPTSVMETTQETLSNGVTLYRCGKVRTITTGGAYARPLCTLDEGDRPVANVTVFGKVYNGSSYVECVTNINATNGNVTVLDAFGSEIAGIQISYLVGKTITYLTK